MQYGFFTCLACGSHIKRSASLVFKAPLDSCGCMKGKRISDKMKLGDGQTILNNAYRSHLKSANKRSLVSELTFAQYVDIIKNPCRYCGGFSVRKSSKQNKHFKEALLLNSVDRLNNERYYRLDNSVAACFTCQTMKWSLTEKDFVAHASKINSYRRNV